MGKLKRFEIYCEIKGFFGDIFRLGVVSCKNELEAKTIAKDWAIKFYQDWKEVYGLKSWENIKEELKENGKNVGYQVTNEFLLAGGSIDPLRWLAVSGVSRDTFNNSPSDWIEPKGNFDFTKGTMTFVFPWDFDAANGYEQVRVVYTMHP